MTNTSGKTAIQPNNFISGLFNGNLFKKQTFSLSEVLSTSDVDAIKAYNEQIDNCVTSQTAFNRTMLDASKDAQNVVAAANGNKVALDGLTKSSKAAELGMKALAMAGNMLLIYALTSAVDIIYKCATASDRLAESAAQMGSEFASTKSDISDYKTKIEELYQTINDDTSSYEDTYNARQELLKIQDEMIDKFGNEADAVKLVTDAINGQTDSLDTLTQDKWQETVNAFNSDSGKGWTEKVADAFANIGHGNNFQRMIDEMENTKVTFHMIPMYGDDTYEEFSKKLKKDFGADITRSERDDAITLSGDLDTIYKQLLNIQTLAKGMGIDDTFLDDLGNQADEAKSKIDEYQEMYSQHILYDKIFNSEDYEKSFDEINKAYKKYQDTFASGDEESIEKAKQNYAKIVQSATEGLDDQSVIDYFNSMYPDLQEVVGGWEFEVKFKAAVDDDSDDFEKSVQDAVNKFDTVEDIKNYNPKAATDKQKDAYLQLKQYADEYGLTLDQLIDKLVQLGLLQSQSKSDLLNKLIPSKSSPTAGVASVLTDTMDSVDTDEATKWVKSLTEEEAKLANSKDFENALEEQKKKLNGASLSANDYAAALQTVKDKQNENSEEEETTISLADINKTKSGIGGLFDKYEQNEGYLTQDEVASVLETNPEYIQYLVKVGDQYKLNEQALNDWNEANKEQEQEINNQMGGNDYLGNYSSLLDSIQDNASHPNGGVGNTNIGSQLDDLINKNKEWNTSLQNGEITTAQYFQNMSNAITDSGLEDALHSLNGTFDDSTDYIEETVSVLTTQLSDGLTQSTKRFEEGQTSVQDYIKEINAGSDAEKKLLASTYNLDISQETGKASLDGLSDSALEAAQSYNSLVDSQNALASTSGFVDVLSQNADFLSQYTDEAGNLMDSIFDDSRFNDYVSNMSNSIVDFANQNADTMDQTASWLADTAGMSVEQASSIIAQGGDAVQGAVGNSLSGVQSMTSYAMSQVGSATSNAASAVGNVLTSLGNMISNFSYKITAKPFIQGKSKMAWDPKKGLDVSLPTFGFDISGSGGKSVSAFATSIKNAGSAISKYGASQSASAAFNNINSYKPKNTLSANKPSSYRPTYKPKSSGKSGSGGSGGSGGKNSGGDAEKQNEEYLDKFMAYQKALLEAGKITYQQYSQYVSDELERMYKKGKISASKYYSAVKDMIDEQKSIYDAALKGVTKLLDDEIDKWKDKIDVIEKNNDRETVVDSTLVFGCSKADDGMYENYAIGEIYWAKVWFSDLGEKTCMELASWTHDTLSASMYGFNRYYLSDGSGKRTSMSFIADNVLSQTRMLGAGSSNSGGYANMTIRSWLNTRLYNALSVEWKQLIKLAKIASSVGNQSTEVTTSDNYFYLPSVYELSPEGDMEQEPYTNEGTHIEFFTNASSRIRKSSDGKAQSYWTRSPNVSYNGYFFRVEENGALSGYDYPYTAYGIVVEFSF